MSRVAVIGSCITRDLWPVRGDAVEGLLYVSRTSLPSLFAPPVPGFEPLEEPPGGLTPYQHRAVVWDLAKHALGLLVAHRPTHIILDFIDERFDLLVTPQTIVTYSQELEATGYRDQAGLAGARRIARTSPACAQLWRDAAGEFCAFLAATPLGEAQLIVHESQWAESYRTKDGHIRPFGDSTHTFDGRPSDIAEQNAILADYQRTLMALAPQASRVAASASSRIADERHVWGLSPFHYIDDYYAEIWAQLRALGV